MIHNDDFLMAMITMDHFYFLRLWYAEYVQSVFDQVAFKWVLNRFCKVILECQWEYQKIKSENLAIRSYLVLAISVIIADVIFHHSTIALVLIQ